jgi:hypothetical protein
MLEQIRMPDLPSPASTSVRIDASTRERLGVLRKRLLDQSSKAVSAELRRGGIPLGLVVELGLQALERELDGSGSVPDPKTGERDHEGPD